MVAYNGIIGTRPTSAAHDSQTPFDNLSWQTFVAINWTKGKENQPAQVGLQGNGPRVWEGWPRLSAIFGNGPVRATCSVPPGVAVFQIASDGRGNPVAQNEEYISSRTASSRRTGRRSRTRIRSATDRAWRATARPCCRSRRIRSRTSVSCPVS